MPARKKPMARSVKNWRAKEGYVAAERRNNPNDPETVCREDLSRRSRGWCELCAKQPASQLHHRRTREVKWSKWIVENCLDLCRACHHDIIHANVDWARRHGLILSRHGTTHPPPVLTCSLSCEIDHLA